MLRKVLIVPYALPKEAKRLFKNIIAATRCYARNRKSHNLKRIVVLLCIAPLAVPAIAEGVLSDSAE